jgi:hypothetical protein
LILRPILFCFILAVLRAFAALREPAFRFGNRTPLQALSVGWFSACSASAGLWTLSTCIAEQEKYETIAVMTRGGLMMDIIGPVSHSVEGIVARSL